MIRKTANYKIFKLHILWNGLIYFYLFKTMVE